MFDFNNYSAKSIYYNDSNKLVVTIKEFVGLKPKIYSFLVDDSSEHKKTKGANKNVVATIIHNEYKNDLLNQKFLRHLMNRIQRKNYRIGTYEVNKANYKKQLS